MSTVDSTYREPTFTRRPGPRTALIVLGVIAAVVAVVLAVKAVTGGDESPRELKGSGGDSFKLAFPDGWQAIPKERLQRLAGHPLAVLRREDGKGYVILRKEKRAPADFEKFSSSLTRELDRRVPDFQRQSSRVVQLQAGKAFFFSYIRTKRGTVHSVVVVPAGDRSYALNTVSRGGSEDVARQIARIILSFDV